MDATFTIPELDERLDAIEAKLDRLLAERSQSEWMTVDETAVYLSMTPAAFRQRRKRTNPPPSHTGLGERSPRFRRSEIDEWVTGDRRSEMWEPSGNGLHGLSREDADSA